MGASTLYGGVRTGEVFGNETVGTVMSQLVYLMENYIYAGTDSSGEPIPLNDVDKYREFWHKVWSVASAM